MWRRWLAILAVAALAIAAIAVAEISSLATEGQPHGISQAYNQYQPVYASLVQLLLGGWNWLRAFFDHDTISALGIVVTAGFTGTSWWSYQRALGNDREARTPYPAVVASGKESRRRRQGQR
jgi:hypothetical protein